MIERYSRPAMARVWSDEAKLERWFDVEIAALEAWAEVGAIPAADVQVHVAVAPQNAHRQRH